MTPILEGLAGKNLFEWVTIAKESFHPIVVFPHKSSMRWHSPIELKKAPHRKFKSMYPHLDVYDVNLDKHDLHKKWIRFLQRFKFSFVIKDDECNPLILSFVIYLHDVSEHAGATVLWPGSHIELENHALKTNRRPPAMVREGYEPNGPFHEAVGHQGDVIIYARNLIHSSSLNISPHPRVAVQGRIMLAPTGIQHCRKGIKPRTVVEQIYDRHFARYNRYHYFGE